MPPKKKARSDPSGVFVVTAATTKTQVPRDVRVVRIDGSVRGLPDEIFKDCRTLETVFFWEGTYRIGKEAFHNCINLSNVKLPSTLQEILDEAFSQCSSLASIDLPLFLKVIGKRAFCSTGLTRLEVPTAVASIEEGAFEYCQRMVSIVLPPKLPMIADYLCMGCTQLKDIRIPTTVESIGMYAFCDCWTLSSMDLTHCIDCMAIGMGAFGVCQKLASILLPPTLESMSDGAFSNCTLLTHIRVPPNVTSIGDLGSIVHSCSSLLSLEVPEQFRSLRVIPNGRIQGGGGGIKDCLSLVNLFVPPSPEIQVSPNTGSLPSPEVFQLAKVATDWADLGTKLQHRFDDLPLHKLCYFHSYHPAEETIKQIQSILQLDPDAANKVDTFGMTPMHVLSLAQKPVVPLLQELLDIAKMALDSKDFFGSTPLVYLCKNPLREGMNAARWMIRNILARRLPFLGLDRWKQELLEVEERVKSAVDISSLSGEARSLEDKYSRFEFLEVLSLMEHFVWRIKLNENVMGEEDATEEHRRIGRENCRVQCGMSIVVANVLPFLGKPAEATQTHVVHCKGRETSLISLSNQ